MAVTIDEMQVDVQRAASAAPAARDAPPPKEPPNLRAEKEMMEERELRLKAD